MICVSATGPTYSGTLLLGPFTNVDAPAICTNFGVSAIDVAAPAENYSFDGAGNFIEGGWIWESCASTSRTFDANGNIIRADYYAGYPVWLTVGTSEASPQVAGLAALLVS